jgi:thiol-disulfide isomerase/thioredoxin
MSDRTRSFRLALASAAILVASACSATAATPDLGSSGAASGVPVTAASSMTAQPTDAAPSTTDVGNSPLPDQADGPVVPTLDQAWATAELVDVTTGDTFRIADHAGKVIFVETMAIWCPTCRAQQTDVRAALGSLPAESVAYVVLDVDPSESADSLARYRKSNSFVGTYAIAGKAVARALAEDFGDQVLNPPSTPIVIVSTDGRVTLTDFGRKSPTDIVGLAKANGA